MNIQKNKLIESIRDLNRKNPIKESKDIQRVLPPADADAFEQHEQALEANKKRLDPKNYEKDVKELIDETASEESRYRHFDVVDRKDLAKKINEAKEKGLQFKISRSMKEGFRYDFKVLKEDFMKKDAGDPDINTSAFNKATDVGSSVCESYSSDTCELLAEISSRADLRDALNCLDDEHFYILFDTIGVVADSKPHNNYPLDDFDSEDSSDLDETIDLTEGSSRVAHLRKLMLGEGQVDPMSDSDYLQEECDQQDPELDEELKIYTSNLSNFHPSKRSEHLWDDIKENNKIEDLEYALEALYPDGISDEALDDMLSQEEDWIRDLIGLPIDGEEEPTEEEPVDEFEDDEIDPLSMDDADDYEEYSYVGDDNSDFEEEPEEDSSDKKELRLDDEEEEPKKAKKEETEVIESLDKDSETERTKDIDDKEEDDINLSKLAEGFVSSQYKPNDSKNFENAQTVEVENSIKESAEDDEVVTVDDSMVEDMLGMPKQEDKKEEAK